MLLFSSSGIDPTPVPMYWWQMPYRIGHEPGPFPEPGYDLPRLMKHVEKKDNGCWEWQGHIALTGYGMFSIRRKNDKGKTISAGAHVVSYVLHNKLPDMPNAGRDPNLPALCVMHSCDNPPCVNPAHLSLGTRRENHEDKVRKGRQIVGKDHALRWRGEKHAHALVTDKQVIEIRKRRAAGESNIGLAKEFGMSQSAMSSLCHGIAWSHLPGAITSSGKKLGPSKGYLKKVRKAYDLQEAGCVQQTIAEHFNVSIQAIRSLFKRYPVKPKKLVLIRKSRNKK